MILRHRDKRKNNRRLAMVALYAVVSLTASWAYAQEAPDARPITLSVGGMAAPNVDSGLSRGWDLMAGGGFAATRWSHHRDWRLYLTGNFLFEHLGVTPDALAKASAANSGLRGATGADARFYSLTFDPTFRFGDKRRVSGYVEGGAGWLRRSIDFAAASGSVLLQPGPPSILSPGSSSAVLDAGLGMNVRLRGSESVMWFAEARYLHGLAINRTTTLVPISVGLRW